MSNHFHILLEGTPFPAEGIPDEELLERLRAIQSETSVATVAQELAKARAKGDTVWAEAIRKRHTYRMHNLSEFMKSTLQRFCPRSTRTTPSGRASVRRSDWSCGKPHGRSRWYNREHDRRGTLWEERFKSVIVESGIAARTMAAYIDLNPVRAGMVSDPADYRWSSYGEAVGGGSKGNGKKAREGLVRACMSHHGAGFEAEKWKEVSRIYRRAMGLALGRKPGKVDVNSEAAKCLPDMNLAEALSAKDNGTVLPDLKLSAMLWRRVRYFSDGAVIGIRAFVNEAFAAARERFGARRKDGARKMRGGGAGAAGVLWSARDLRIGM